MAKRVHGPIDFGVWGAVIRNLASNNLAPMAPVPAIPRLLARHGLTFEDIALWEIHETFSAQVACHVKALEDARYVHEKAGIDQPLGRFPRERMNPNDGSVALGIPSP